MLRGRNGQMEGVETCTIGELREFRVAVEHLLDIRSHYVHHLHKTKSFPNGDIQNDIRTFELGYNIILSCISD